MTDSAKQRLRDLVAARGTDLKAVSLAIGKNHAYLAQFITRGVPRRLPEDVREALGSYFSVDPDTFRDTPRPRVQLERGGVRLDPGKLRRAILIAEMIVAERRGENRGELVIEIASAIYDVLAEREVSGRAIDDADAVDLIKAVLDRLRP